MVVYKDIEGFPGYRAGDDGSIWSCRPRNGKGAFRGWRRLKPKVDSHGYIVVNLRNNGCTHSKLVHSLVCTAFIGQRPPGMHCCHNDGNRKNNEAGNLRWDTPQSNQADRIIHGTDLRGAQVGTSKLSEAQVRIIRSEISNGVALSKIGRRYGVSRTAILKIKMRHTWRHVR